jgi:hypothetical protein
VAIPDYFPGGYPDDSWQFTYNPDQAKKATLSELGNLLKQNDAYVTLIIWRDNLENNNTGDRLIVYKRSTKEWNLNNIVNPNSLEDLTYEFPQNGDGDSSVDEYKVMFLTADEIARDMTGITSTLTMYYPDGTLYKTETVQGNKLLSNLTNFMDSWGYKVTVNIPGYVDQENTGAFYIYWRQKKDGELNSLPSLDPAQDDYDTDTINYTHLFSITGFKLGSSDATVYEIPKITSSTSDYKVSSGYNEALFSKFDLKIKEHTIYATETNIITNLGRYSMTVVDSENRSYGFYDPTVKILANSNYNPSGDLEMYIKEAQSETLKEYYVFPLMDYKSIYGSSINTTGGSKLTFIEKGSETENSSVVIDAVYVYSKEGTDIRNTYLNVSLNRLYQILGDNGMEYPVVAAFIGTNEEGASHFGTFHFWWELKKTRAVLF